MIRALPDSLTIVLPLASRWKAWICTALWPSVGLDSCFQTTFLSGVISTIVVSLVCSRKLPLGSSGDVVRGVLAGDFPLDLALVVEDDDVALVLGEDLVGDGAAGSAARASGCGTGEEGGDDGEDDGSVWFHE